MTLNGYKVTVTVESNQKTYKETLYVEDTLESRAVCLALDAVEAAYSPTYRVCTYVKRGTFTFTPDGIGPAPGVFFA